ncbi:MAG: hypothetical protein HPY55_08030 [Firmicutes bacterium]|nr:hypothetical protein [Bacillota bacterium]
MTPGDGFRGGPNGIDGIDDLGSANQRRVETAAALKQPDRVPVNLCASAPWVASVAGVPLKTYYEDVAVMFESQMRLRERFYGLTPLWADTGIVNEPSALGAKLTWGEDGTPWVEPFVNGIDDVLRLKVPDPRNDGFMARTLEILRYMKSRAPDGVPVSCGSVHSPWGVAALLRGVTQFCTDIYEDPALVKALLEICTETVLAWLRAQAEVAGGLKTILINDDISSFVSPKTFRALILPLYERIYDEFPSAHRWYHNDANASHLLEGIAAARVEVFHLGNMVDIAAARERIGDRVCLMGNIPPVEVLRDGAPGDVRDHSRRVMEAAARGGGLILAPGGYTAEGTPPENVDAMIQAALEFKMGVGS